MAVARQMLLADNRQPAEPEAAAAPAADAAEAEAA
jgi:hypothetical protein